MTNIIQFPNVKENIVGEDAIPTVNARDLHGFLSIKTRFNDWIVQRIKEFQFIENKDFTTFTENLVKGRPRKEYHLTMDMAKELSMVERTERGRQARQYFIDCEKKLIEQKQQPVHYIPNNLGDALRLAADQADHIEKLEETVEARDAVIEQQQAKLDAVTPQLEKMEKRFVRPDLPERPNDAITLTAAAKQMGLTCPKLTSKLASDGYMTRDGEHWVASREVTASGLLYNHRSSYFTRKDKEWHISNQVLVPKAAVEALAVLAGREVA